MGHSHLKFGFLWLFNGIFRGFPPWRITSWFLFKPLIAITEMGFRPLIFFSMELKWIYFGIGSTLFMFFLTSVFSWGWTLGLGFIVFFGVGLVCFPLCFIHFMLFFKWIDMYLWWSMGFGTEECGTEWSWKEQWGCYEQNYGWTSNNNWLGNGRIDSTRKSAKQNLEISWNTKQFWRWAVFDIPCNFEILGDWHFISDRSNFFSVPKSNWMIPD